MKKAKALFAGMIIVVVAAASAGLWYLNENGKLGAEEESTAETTAEIQEGDNNAADETPDGNGAGDTENQTTTEVYTEVTTSVNADDYDIDGFLSTFSKVYFAENRGTFDINSYSDYDLIMFAYLHIKITDRSLLGEEMLNDSIGAYTTIAYDDIDSIVRKYFGVSVAKESVYTENDYDFFRYEDGYFYTPAADGVGFTNTCRANYVSVSGDVITVEFTVFADETEYASGEAKIRINGDSMNLQYYSISY